MRAAHDRRVVVVAAAAGSGKSTLLGQWVASEARPAGWLSVGPAHRDPVQLVTDIARSMATARPDGAVAEALPRLQGTDALRNLARLSRALDAEAEGWLLVIDDLHLLDDQRAVDVVTTLADRTPANARLALGSRSASMLPLGRWRASGRILEIGFADLALDLGECRELLETLGLDVRDDTVTDVHARTEGWAAGVVLAGVALRSGGRPAGTPRFSGEEASIRSFLETEILAGLEPAARDLLVRTSVLDVVSGPLGDALTGRTGSARVLERLASSNQMIAPLDGEWRTFRYHSLLRDLLRRHLGMLEPGPAEMHRRAAAWFESAGDLEHALEHAHEAGDTARATRLLMAVLQPAYRAGRIATLQRWLDGFGADIHWLPEVSAVAALLAALEGDAPTARRWLVETLAKPWVPDLARGGQAGPDAWLVKALMCPEGPRTMLVDADRSLDAHDEAWTLRPLALLVAGAAHAMLGEDEAAQARYTEAERATEIRPANARLVLRAERALWHIGQRRWPQASAILEIDRTAVLDDAESGRIAGVIWLVADSRLSAHRGDLSGARERLRRAQLGRTRLSWAMPWYGVRALTELARTQLLLDDVQGARASLAQAREIVEVRPDLGVLGRQLDEVMAQAISTSAARRDGTSLTPAELRLLPLLQTYLSFKEIGSHLGISGNTVKSEAMSIYAKLEATSRSEAVERAVSFGLLEDILA